ncbi:MAG: phosphoribosylaminoimidazolesuccinocarboxamide synthase [Deltaproteobacteria bacterium]|nr:phosphoribosylaminoimidazolesuccinocarboxamide synthase [Deltaproteobacteria bacterium]
MGADTNVVMETQLSGLNLLNRGKVRDIYDLGDTLLIVATDRISAFDVIMSDPIPGKGEILTKISEFWFRQMTDLIDNHVLSFDVADFPKTCRPHADVLRNRTMWVKKAKPLTIECIVRGYLAGSGWKDYKNSGSVCGYPLPSGLLESAELAEPLFTPSTKAELGTHDENITLDQAERLVGKERLKQVREASLSIYKRARAIAKERGIVIADTKFEFGDSNGKLILIDEILTPDSSRFWPRDEYEPGRSQRSYDKQFLRDYLESLDWDKRPPAPKLPPDIIEQTRKRYREALERLTG